MVFADRQSSCAISRRVSVPRSNRSTVISRAVSGSARTRPFGRRQRSEGVVDPLEPLDSGLVVVPLRQGEEYFDGLSLDAGCGLHQGYRRCHSRQQALFRARPR